MGKWIMITTMRFDLKVKELHQCWNHSFSCQRCLLETMPIRNRNHSLHSHQNDHNYISHLFETHVTESLPNSHYSVHVNQAFSVWSFICTVCFNATASSASCHQVCHLYSNIIMLSTVFQTCSGLSLNQVKYSCLPAWYLSVYLMILFLCPSQNIDFNSMPVLQYNIPLVMQSL